MWHIIGSVMEITMLTYALMPGINIGSDRFCHLLFILDIYYLLFILESLIIDKLLKLIFGHSNTHIWIRFKTFFSCLRNTWRDLSLNREMGMIYSWYNVCIIPDLHYFFFQMFISKSNQMKDNASICPQGT